MSTKHTPGPWIYLYDGSGDFSVYGVDGAEVGTAWSKDAHFMGNGEASYRNEANARLIAAAPELLEALEVLARLDIADLGGRPDDYPVYGRNNSLISCGDVRKVRAAIAKAKGEA